MSKRNIINIKLIEDYLKCNSESKLISKEYKNATSKLDLICSCGNTYSMSWDKIQQSKYKSCVKCANKYSRESTRKASYLNARNMAEKNGCQLLLDECDYKKTKQICKYKCSCGEIFETTIDTFRSSKYKACKKCTIDKMTRLKEVNGSKVTLRKMETYILSESSCKIKKIHGASVDSRIDLVCDCGTEFWMTYKGFKNSKHKKCRKCVVENWPKENIYNAYDYEFVKRELDNYGVELLQDYYNNSREKLKLKCTCGEIFHVAFTRFFKEGQRQCKKCGYQNGATKQTMSVDEFKDRVLVILGEDYEVADFKKVSNDVRMIHKTCGKTYTQKGSKILSGQRCSHCYAPKKKVFEDVDAEIKSICGEELKLIEYNNHDNMILKCKCGNKLKRGMSEIRKHKGAFCEKCKVSSGVIQIEAFLNHNNIAYIREHSFDGCVYKRKLRFDFYIPDFNLCIEYDGEQHYRTLYHWGGEKGLHLNKIRDNIKNEYCKSNDIELLRISFKEENINNILENKICQYRANLDC
ncbi:MAG: hypothetical protein ACRCX2_36030 [Paraclostridium sp.]